VKAFEFKLEKKEAEKLPLVKKKGSIPKNESLNPIKVF